MVSGNTGATLGGSEIGCIAVYPEDHVAGMVTDGDIRMSGAIMEELCDSFHGCLGAFGLFGGNGAQLARRVLSTALA